MEIEPVDGAVFIYTFGVMFSALWLSTPGTPPLNLFIFALFAVVSLGWTAYFKWQIAPQFIPDEDEEEEEPETPRPPTVEE
ncbi:hypothetical protein C475_13007 [Halosimplex carlsbadense 2-9-1]|uniref:DUF8074 domain-containing protein n=1 Tax=Halosimplex carlsbadense 2-9-1 TaxID=797114 RepID=M0CQK4_9EURY|nr:hypothetical protein [Halosimplex carlsbadense]ELZ24169.1 hypothetical protein C475_13007 [Halosimplex carlsbadense 2-9-1]